MLPIHPQPQEDEALSSWITRLAIENGLYSQVLFKGVLGFNEPIFTRDVDRLPSPGLIKLLSRITAQPESALIQLKLNALEGEVFEKLNFSGKNHWILPLGIYHRTKRRRGVVYCPLCLQQDNYRYYRKSWRLAFVTLCPKHGCLLKDQCDFCLAEVDYQRLGIGAKDYELPVSDLGLCHQCNKPLCGSPPEYLSHSEGVLSIPYLHFLKRFSQCKPVLPELKQPLDLQVFNGLWVLTGRLMSKRAHGVRIKIFRDTGIKLAPIKGQEGFEFLPLRQRLEIMMVLILYLEDWPTKFIELVKGTKFSLSAFTDNVTHIPFWLNSVISAQLNFSSYVVTDEEIVSAMRYLQSKKEAPTKVELARLLGLHISSLNKRYSKLFNCF